MSINMFILVRPPVLQEDEGRYEFETPPTSLEAVKAKRSQLVTESNGYFSYVSYEIYELVHFKEVLEHQLKTQCERPETCGGACNICSGLSLCTVCGGAEASLPTDCPGYRMNEYQDKSVQDGSLDFIDGSWVTK